MYTLYWNPESSSLAPMAVLEEVGALYETVLVDIAGGEHFTPAYKTIHPYGRVPAMKLPDGRYVFESAGILMYLVDQHPGCGLAPRPDQPDRAIYYQWLLFLTDTIYPSYHRFFRPEWYIPDAADTDKIIANARTLLAEQWGVVDRALEARDWLVGERFSAADIYMQMIASWDRDGPGFARRFPNVVRVGEAVARHPAVARARARHSPS